MNYDIVKLPKKVSEITVKIPWVDVTKKYEEMLVEMVKQAELKGFRKGKAPRDLVEKNLDKKTFYSEVLNNLLTETYSEIIKETGLNPIVMPRINVISQEEGKDWSYKATVCELPVVELGSYKDELSKKNAKEKIWVPGKDQKAEEPDKNKKLNDNLGYLLEHGKVELSDIVIEEEMTKLLSELLEEVKKLGLNLDQYLASTRKTVESIREEYKQKAENSVKLEFILSKISDIENIIVSQEDLDKALAEVKEEKLKEQLKGSSYQLSAMLRRQKTLDFIAGL